MDSFSCLRSESFSAAWDVALQHAARQLLDVAFERAFKGSTEPVFDRDGCRTGTRFRQNDRLLMFLLRAYLPERFRHAHRDWKELRCLSVRNPQRHRLQRSERQRRQ